jgi:hypothetical protein
MCDDLVALKCNGIFCGWFLVAFGRGRSMNPFSQYMYACMYLPHSHRETLSAAKTVAVLANSFATRRGTESFWWSSILVINYRPRRFDCL